METSIINLLGPMIIPRKELCAISPVEFCEETIGKYPVLFGWLDCTTELFSISNLLLCELITDEKSSKVQLKKLMDAWRSSRTRFDKVSPVKRMLLNELDPPL